MGSFPSHRAADWWVCTISLYIGASRRLIGTRAPIYRRVACNELTRLSSKAVLGNRSGQAKCSCRMDQHG